MDYAGSSPAAEATYRGNVMRKSSDLYFVNVSFEMEEDWDIKQKKIFDLCGKYPESSGAGGGYRDLEFEYSTREEAVKNALLLLNEFDFLDNVEVMYLPAGKDYYDSEEVPLV